MQVPFSSGNKVMEAAVGSKRRLVVLNKSDMADSASTSVSHPANPMLYERWSRALMHAYPS